MSKVISATLISASGFPPNGIYTWRCALACGCRVTLRRTGPGLPQEAAGCLCIPVLPQRAPAQPTRRAS